MYGWATPANDVYCQASVIPDCYGTPLLPIFPFLSPLNAPPRRPTTTLDHRHDRVRCRCSLSQRRNSEVKMLYASVQSRCARRRTGSIRRRDCFQRAVLCAHSFTQAVNTREPPIFSFSALEGGPADKFPLFVIIVMLIFGTAGGMEVCHPLVHRILPPLILSPPQTSLTAACRKLHVEHHTVPLQLVAPGVHQGLAG